MLECLPSFSSILISKLCSCRAHELGRTKLISNRWQELDRFSFIFTLRRTRAVYEFVRRPKRQGRLGIAMHVWENTKESTRELLVFGEVGIEEEEDPRCTVDGAGIGLVYEVMRDGRMCDVLVGIFQSRMGRWGEFEESR